MLEYLCCDLYRSPSWPVWAPRIPNTSQNSSTQQQPTKPETSLNIESPTSSSILRNPRNRFWSTSSPVSSCEEKSVRSSLRSSIAVVPLSNEQNETNENGIVSNDTCRRVNENVENEIGVFKIPGPQDVTRTRQLRKNYDRHSFDSSNEHNVANSSMKNRNGQQNSVVAPIAKPRIGHPSWRNISKTCDCIEKGNMSPVLRLADQARAVSSPDPLHRPDNPRASLRSATTAQTLR